MKKHLSDLIWIQTNFHVVGKRHASSRRKEVCKITIFSCLFILFFTLRWNYKKNESFLLSQQERFIKESLSLKHKPTLEDTKRSCAPVLTLLKEITSKSATLVVVLKILQHHGLMPKLPGDPEFNVKPLNKVFSFFCGCSFCRVENKLEKLVLINGPECTRLRTRRCVQWDFGEIQTQLFNQGRKCDLKRSATKALCETLWTFHP